jgi:hypothetical protein
MPEVMAFKSGKDLGEPQIDDDDTVTCVNCGAIETDRSAYEGGWQLFPAVCPNCLRWTAVATEPCCFEMPS